MTVEEILLGLRTNIYFHKIVWGECDANDIFTGERGRTVEKSPESRQCRFLLPWYPSILAPHVVCLASKDIILDKLALTTSTNKL